MLRSASTRGLAPPGRVRSKRNDDGIAACVPPAGPPSGDCEGAQPRRPAGGRRRAEPGDRTGAGWQLCVLPRLATIQTYSRIGLAGVVFNRRGDPVGVERLGVVLEPQASHERNTQTGGGVEDPRVTHIAARGL
jgi:hypothetical protein